MTDPTPLEKQLDEVQKWQQVKNLAMEYFPGRVQITTAICDCCGETHFTVGIMLKPKIKRNRK